MDVLGVCSPVNSILSLRTLIIGVIVTLSGIGGTILPIPIINPIIRQFTHPIIAYLRSILTGIAGLVSICLFYKLTFCIT